METNRLVRFQSDSPERSQPGPKRRYLGHSGSGKVSVRRTFNERTISKGQRHSIPRSPPLRASVSPGDKSAAAGEGEKEIALTGVRASRSDINHQDNILKQYFKISINGKK